MVPRSSGRVDCSRRRRPRLAQHAAGGSVPSSSLRHLRSGARAAACSASSTRSPRPVKKRVRPAPKEPLPSTANAAATQETRQTCTEGAAALDSERAPPLSVRVDELQRLRVALTRSGNRRLEDDHSTEHMHDRKRMTIAVRVDTNDIVHLICKHPIHLQPRLGTNSGVGLGWKTARGTTVTGHAPPGRTGF